MRFAPHALLPCALLLLSASPRAAAAPADPPALTVSKLLAAACEQNQAEFARYLPARSARAYARLTEPSRLALMKRFSFQEARGKAISGENYAMRCQSAAQSVELEIGGAEIQEHLAFLPVVVRLTGAAGDGGPARRVQIGLVLEGGSWKLLSAGLLLLDLPALELEWNRASMDANESGTISAIRQIAQAIESYRRTFAHLPERIEQLGPPKQGASSPAAAGLLDAELAAGSRSGYRFRYVIVGASALGAQARFELAAVPAAYGSTGLRSFLLDAQGVLHAGDRRGALASENDPPIAMNPSN